MGPGEQPMDLCESCYREYEEIWCAPSLLWEHVTGSKWNGLYCMPCFTLMASEKGLTIHWRPAVVEKVDGMILDVDERLKKTGIEDARTKIENDYKENPTGCEGSFGEILCYEIHQNNLTFLWLAKKWGISVSDLGILIWDHCKKLSDEQ